MNRFMGYIRDLFLKVLNEYLKIENDNSILAFLKKANTGNLQLEDSEKTTRAFFNINSPSDILILERLLDPKL